MVQSTDLIGRWVSPSPEPIHNPDGSVIYGIRDFVFTARAWSLRFIAFGDDKAAFKLFALRCEGRYDLGAAHANAAGARDADFHFNARYMTAYLPNFVEMFNGAGAGNGNWKAGEEQDITQTGAAFIPSSVQCPTEYDLVKLNGDNLYLGDRSFDLCAQRAAKPGALAITRA